ncbi:MAG TPA: DinB family protein [Bryobacteraceae bacterium]|jgi:uncharacterized damage-inducible protein DinB
MRYQFLIDTYETERIKVVSVWSMFHEDDLDVRPHATDTRGRSAREHMEHQCIGENNWFREMFGIDVGGPPLPSSKTRAALVERYAEDSLKRLAALREKDDAWWEAEVKFFDVPRSRAWIMVRRIAHTAHHRGQQMTLLRVINRDVFSNYGPTADTEGVVRYLDPASVKRAEE